jgi:hypothetical protein
MIAMWPRTIGLAMVAGGVALGWFFGLKPLWDAEAGLVREVQVGMKLFLVAPMCILFGAMLLIGGRSVGESFAGPPQTARDHWLIWPAFAVACAAGFGAWWWMEQRLEAIGFVTGF